VLILDDIHIPSIYRMFEILREDAMFELLRRDGNTAIFRRTEAPTFPPTADGWWEQGYNAARFPIELDPKPPEPEPEPEPIPEPMESPMPGPLRLLRRVADKARRFGVF